MTKKEMKYSSYYFDDNEAIFKHCLNECITYDSETYCSKCSEGYHFIYNEIGKCITEPKNEDLLYLDEKTNTYKKCPKGTIKVENNECIKSSKAPLIILILLILLIFILIIIFALFFFYIKRYISRKKYESETSILLKKLKD